MNIREFDRRFILALAERLDEIRHLLGKDWPLFKAKLMALARSVADARDDLTVARAIDALLNTAEPSPTGELLDHLFRHHSPPTVTLTPGPHPGTPADPLAIERSDADSESESTAESATLIAAARTLAVAAEDYWQIPVFYVTDRAPSSDPAPDRFFGGERGIGTRYGIVTVSIPEDHRLGAIESPRWWKLEFRRRHGKHVTLEDVSPASDSTFFATLQQRVADASSKDAFVFVHGYNVDFAEAARRTAQLAYDLQFEGAPILYSRPSRGELAHYLSDGSNAEWTRPHLEAFLDRLAADSGAETIHLIAHSMGNRPLIYALDALAARPADSARFNEVVFTAPDVDAAVFEQLVTKVRGEARRLTLYASDHDKAPAASRRLNGFPRAGNLEEAIVVHPNLDTIDASSVETDFLGHAYFADHRTLLSDIHALLRDGKPVEQRFGMRRGQRNHRPVWLFAP